ncbi:hypothetical protein J6590_090605 [Homalodisca vitripennis]|nr:hypothetical protein J6590_090605 [Homalodisca vitripennis]
MGRVGGHGSLAAVAKKCLYSHLNRKYIVNRSRQTAYSRTKRTDVAETVLVSVTTTPWFNVVAPYCVYLPPLIS